MPGDATCVEEFAARTWPPLLGDLFEQMVAEMRLAGELGPLLAGRATCRIQAGAYVAADGQPAELRRRPPPAKRTIGVQMARPGRGRAAPGRCGGSPSRAAGRCRLRRRLFADDAAQGIALIDLLPASGSTWC